MAKVHILNVNVHNNPATFFTPFQFEIYFECLEELQDDLEFKIIYVGSAETLEHDQCLDQIVVDAVPKGQFKFMFQVWIFSFYILNLKNNFYLNNEFSVG